MTDEEHNINRAMISLIVDDAAGLQSLLSPYKVYWWQSLVTIHNHRHYANANIFPYIRMIDQYTITRPQRVGTIEVLATIEKRLNDYLDVTAYSPTHIWWVAYVKNSVVRMVVYTYGDDE